MNKRTIVLTTEQYKEIIQTMREGFCGCRPNERIATALVLEGNLGLRISDILSQIRDNRTENKKETSLYSSPCYSAVY